jgi:hypothetical protein
MEPNPNKTPAAVEAPSEGLAKAKVEEEEDFI